MPFSKHDWRCRGRILSTGRRTLVMGILNVTPDSFSDGGLFLDSGDAINHGLQMLAEGADILDLGAESTRPGSQPVPPQEQIRRLRPVMQELRKQSEVYISIDTASAIVARQLLDLGADIINDISALRGDPEMASTVAEYGAGLILMHMLGTPTTMQQNPVYGDVVAEVRTFLGERAAHACQCGIDPAQIAIDPGIGFGKTVEHNLQLLAHVEDLFELGYPVLIGASRKSFIGKILNVDVQDRLEGSLAVVASSILKGASIVRVHDVQPTRRVVDMLNAMMNYE